MSIMSSLYSDVKKAYVAACVASEVDPAAKFAILDDSLPEVRAYDRLMQDYLAKREEAVHEAAAADEKARVEAMARSRKSPRHVGMFDIGGEELVDVELHQGNDPSLVIVVNGYYIARVTAEGIARVPFVSPKTTGIATDPKGFVVDLPLH